MRPKLLLMLSGIILVTASQARMLTPDSVSGTEIKKLQFMTGNWTGTGWMKGRDGVKQTFNQEEQIQFKLDSTILVIEGTGKNNGKKIHHAFAVISYDKTEKKYDFQSYLADGRNGKFRGEWTDEKFIWYPAENIRYIIELNKSGEWHETGEMNRDGIWFQFFEMKLKKESIYR